VKICPFIDLANTGLMSGWNPQKGKKYITQRIIKHHFQLTILMKIKSKPQTLNLVRKVTALFFLAGESLN
jgi:hypothetical protein